MQYQSILEWTRQKPFEPFKLLLTDGEVIEVRHPEFVMPTYSHIVVGVKFDKEGVPQSSRFVSYMHVVKIEPLAIPVSGANATATGS